MRQADLAWLASSLTYASYHLARVDGEFVSVNKDIQTWFFMLVISTDGLSHSSYGIPRSTFTPLSLEKKMYTVNERIFQVMNE